MAANSILFVFIEKDPSVTENLRQILQRRQNDWSIEIAAGGREALKIMSQQLFDVIVTDLMMPEMNGVELLKKVEEQYPQTIRFVLSNDTDKELVLQSASLAHRHVTKPFEPETLRAFLNSSLGLREVLSMGELHARIATIGSLPSPPEIYNKLVAELQSETVSIKIVAEIISKDISLTAKMLQMVNSAFFGLPARVDSPLQAVNLLGLETVKGLVLTAGVFSQFTDPGIAGISIESIYSHSLATGALAQKVARVIGLEKRHFDEALLAGMLHDVGKLVMLVHFQKEMKETISMATEESIPVHEAEQKVMKITHAEIGGHLLSLWGLPDSTLEAVALHHSPSRFPIPMPSILTAVHIADALYRERDTGKITGHPSYLNSEYISSLGLQGRLDELQELCQVEETVEN